MNRNKVGIYISMFGVFINLFLCVFKVIVGYSSNSLSIITDSFNNIIDVLSCILLLFGFKLINKNNSKKFSYGFGRLEYLFGFIISLLMFILSIILCYESIIKIVNKDILNINYYNYIILIISFIVKFTQYKLFISYSYKINSLLLRTSGIECKSDLIIEISILLSIIIYKIFNINIDGFISLIISIYIIVISIKLIIELTNYLVGYTNIDDSFNYIKCDINKYGFDIRKYYIHNYGYNVNYYIFIVNNYCNYDYYVVNLFEKYLSLKYKTNIIIHTDVL